MTNRIQVRGNTYYWEARVWFNHAWRLVPGYSKTKKAAVQEARDHIEFLLGERERDGLWHDVEVLA